MNYSFSIVNQNLFSWPWKKKLKNCHDLIFEFLIWIWITDWVSTENLPFLPTNAKEII